MTVCHIPLGRNGQHIAVVDQIDYAYLTQWRWSFKVSRGGKVYARRHRRVDGRRETVLMHNEVLDRMGLVRPTDKHTGDHKNRGSLDNTRGNLRWATKSEQGRNRVLPRRASTRELDFAQEIPF